MRFFRFLLLGVIVHSGMAVAMNVGCGTHASLPTTELEWMRRIGADSNNFQLRRDFSVWLADRHDPRGAYLRYQLDEHESKQVLVRENGGLLLEDWNDGERGVEVKTGILHPGATELKIFSVRAPAVDSREERMRALLPVVLNYWNVSDWGKRLASLSLEPHWAIHQLELGLPVISVDVGSADVYAIQNRAPQLLELGVCQLSTGARSEANWEKLFDDENAALLFARLSYLKAQGAPGLTARALGTLMSSGAFPRLVRLDVRGTFRQWAQGNMVSFDMPSLRHMTTGSVPQKHD